MIFCNNIRGNNFIVISNAASIPSTPFTITETEIGVITGSGGAAFALGSSYDGSVIVGSGNDANSIAYAAYWNGGAGFVSIGNLGGPSSCQATCCSYDGSILVGYGQDSSGNQNAFTWTSSGGFDVLTTPSGAAQIVVASTSYDANVVVGYGSFSSINQAIIWVDRVPTVLGFLANSTTSYSQAMGVSGDGNIIVGFQTDNNTGLSTPWYYSNGVMTALPFITSDLANNPGATALGISGDGSTIFGIYGSTAIGSQPCIWKNGSITLLGTNLTDSLYIQPTCISGDGFTIAGNFGDQLGDQFSFVWTQANGYQVLPNLSNNALNNGILNGGSVFGISGNGKRAVGSDIDTTLGDTVGVYWTLEP